MRSMWVTGLIVLVLAAMNVQRDVPLRINDQMMNLAADQAALMAAEGELAHSDTLAPVPGTYVGENVGTGSSWETIQAAFVQSPEHLANLTDPRFRSVGIGMAEGDGLVWLVQIFSDVEPSVHAEGVAWANSNGLMFGYPDGTFRPEQPVTRGQLATILMRESDRQ